MKKYKLGFIGCGNMAGAIIGCLTGTSVQYLLKCNKVRFDIYGFDADAEKMRTIAGLTALNSAQALAEMCDIIVLSVKPQNAAEAVADIDFSGKTVVSIMAGVGLEKLAELTKADKLVRVMPNLNARVGAAFNGYCQRGLSDEEERIIKLMLDGFGESVKINESDMNALTGIAGSGPAFVFMFVQAFMDAGVRRGFDYDTARKMAIATILGSVYNIEADKTADIDAMVRSVCSKGGTTIRGVEYLQEQNLNGIVGEAIERAIRRAEEMERGE